MNGFEDHFSKRASVYARTRPQYPAELFAWLASIAPGRRLAWDCGTGNGQAAHGLVAHFDRVIATDASASQLEQAVAHERVEYRVGRADEIRLEPGSVDLVTVAAAIHWFDPEPFYEVARRALVADGVLAVWTYHMPVITPAVDRVLTDYHDRVVGPYWPDRFRIVIDHYRSLSFPFAELAPPAFESRSLWNLERLIGFMSTWSASQRYQEERGEDPLRVVRPALEQAWGVPDERRLVRMPLYMRVGSVREAGPASQPPD